MWYIKWIYIQLSCNQSVAKTVHGGGVGIGLLKDYSLDKRKISEEEAYELCDKLIRNNYFAK